MDISEVTTSPGGALDNPVKDWVVHTPVELAPTLQVYRLDLYLRFRTGGQAHQIKINTDATDLQGVFRHYEYDALTSEGVLDDKGQLIFVTLDAPRLIRQINFANIASFGSNLELELYRIDGDTPSEKPTITAGVSSGQASLPASGDVAFTSHRFAIGLRRSNGELASLGQSHIQSIIVRSYPTTPRVGLAPAESQSAPVFFWNSPGEVARPGEGSAHNFLDQGTRFAEELQRYLDTVAASLPPASGGPLPTLPDEIDLRVVIESDAPCRFSLEPVQAGPPFNISFHLVRQGLAGGPEKETLRFPGNEVVTRRTFIDLPREIKVVEASLEVSESFRRDRSQVDEDVNISPIPMLDQRRGVHLDTDHWVGQELNLANAMTVSGVALALMPLANDTEVILELQAGWQGRPSGKKVAEGRIGLERAGYPLWGTLRLAEPVVLSSQPYWVLARAARGHAVWLADAGNKSALILTRASSPQAWEQRSEVPGVSLLYRLYSRGSNLQQRAPVGLYIGGTALPKFTAVNEDGPPVAEGRQRFDLKDALDSFLQQPLEGNNQVQVPISCRSAVTGFLIVYSPKVVYDLQV